MLISLACKPTMNETKFRTFEEITGSFASALQSNANSSAKIICGSEVYDCFDHTCLSLKFTLKAFRDVVLLISFLQCEL